MTLRESYGEVVSGDGFVPLLVLVGSSMVS